MRSLKELFLDLKRTSFDKLDKLYLAVGEELFFKDKTLEYLRKQAIEFGASIEVYTVGVDSQKFSEFLDGAFAGSLFVESKLIIIHNADILKQEQVYQLLGFVANSKSHCTFIHFLKEDKRKKVFKDLRANATVIEMKTQNMRQVPFWIQFIAGEEELKLTQEVIASLELKLGSDLQMLANEIKKLKNYLGDKELTVSLVEDFVSNGRSVNVFDFLEAFFKKNKSLFLKYTYELEAEGELPIYLISLMINRLSKLLLIKDPDDTKNLRLNPFYLKKLQDEAKLYSYKELQELYLRLINIDRLLKSTKQGYSLLYSLVMG